MLNHAPLAETLHRPVPVHRNLAILDVQLLQSAAVVGDALHTTIRNHITIFQAQLFQIRAALRQCPQSRIADVALANIERSQARTRTSQHNNRVVADRLAAARVQVAQLVAAPRNHLQTGIGYLVALGHGQVAERGAQLRQLVQAEVGDAGAVADAQLAQRHTKAGHEAQTGVCARM